jgi:hypothetical protein
MVMRIHWLVIVAAATFMATSEKANACAQTQQEAYQACQNPFAGCGVGSSGSWAQAAYYSCLNACAARAMCAPAGKRAADKGKTTASNNLPVATKDTPAGQRAATTGGKRLENASATTTSVRPVTPTKLEGATSKASAHTDSNSSSKKK